MLLLGMLNSAHKIKLINRFRLSKDPLVRLNNNNLTTKKLDRN
jgi:hypothetical protein